MGATFTPRPFGGANSVGRKAARIDRARIDELGLAAPHQRVGGASRPAGSADVIHGLILMLTKPGSMLL